MSLTISRILHAGYIFEGGAARIAFDPIFENPFSRNCFAFPPVSFDLEKIRGLRLDAVFISHYHDDHCSLESLNLLKRETPIYIFCVFEEMLDLIRELGFKNVHALELDQEVQVGELKVTAKRALDSDVDSIFHIQYQDLNVLNVVDSWIDSLVLEELEKTSWDLILWPFQTLREIEVIAPGTAEPPPESLPPEWIEQLQLLKPHYLVPGSCQFIQESWSWYNHALFPVTYARFAREMKEALPQTEVVRINPGVSFVLHKNSMTEALALEWVLPEGDPNLDYDFRPHQKIPSTSEIAVHFPALSKAQKERVLDYCARELPEKYREMEEPLEAYWDQPRLWKLTFFDRAGESENFYYTIERNKIEKAPPGEAVWSTEIPAAKILAALEEGEALTSLYIRIHAPPGVDIVDDPLIRCLFNRNFGEYQKAQLRRIQGAPLKPKDS